MIRSSGELILDQGVQLVFAGKAHPAISQEKNCWQTCLSFPDLDLQNWRNILADYNAHIIRLMTQGCDVWLNNPRRPREASGTSGQRLPSAANFSILDGWW